MKKPVIYILISFLLFVACATRGEIKRFKVQLDYLESSNAEILKRIAHLDSLTNEQNRLTTGVSAGVDINMQGLQEEMRLVRNALQESGYRAEQLTKKIETVSEELSRPKQIIPDSLDTTSSRTPAEISYRQAFLDQTKGNYQSAIEQYKIFIEKYKESVFIDDAYYQLGECYYTLGNYADAVESYSALYNSYKNSNLTPAALYKGALSYEELGKLKSAKTYYNYILNDYPASNEAKLAKEKIKSIGEGK